MSVQVDLCGVEGNTRVPDGDGIIWSFDITDGLDSPTQEINFGTKTGAVGGSLLADDTGPRILTIDATARTNAANVDLAWRIMKGKLPPRGASGSLVVHEPVVKTLVVRRASRPLVRRHGIWAIKGSLQVAAIDNPFLTSATERTAYIGAGSTVSVTNDGDEIAFLRVVASGSGTVKLRQDDSGQLLQTRVSVAAGTVFDCASRSVTTSGGIPTFPMGSPNEWLSIPAESTVGITSLGSAGVDIFWNDTYS